MKMSFTLVIIALNQDDIYINHNSPSFLLTLSSGHLRDGALCSGNPTLQGATARDVIRVHVRVQCVLQLQIVLLGREI